MTFLGLAEQVLKDEQRPLTANEIWEIAVTKGYHKQLKSEGKTPWATLGAQIYVNVKSSPKTLFAQTDTRPKKFFLRSGESEPCQEPVPAYVPPPKKKFGYLEKDLHPFLAYYAYYHLHCYTKTINHSQSTKKEFGEWVHPDVVGCYYPLDEWKPEVYELSSAIGNVSIKILSFELKRELSFGNLRESFFQTVSNSSWANESYLVASKVSNDPDFMDELTRLSTSFGIGVIELSLEDPHSTKILLPAKHRDTLDWETINKLTINNDFKEFLMRAKIDISSKKIHKKEYDPILEADELKKMLGN